MTWCCQRPDCRVTRTERLMGPVGGCHAHTRSFQTGALPLLSGMLTSQVWQQRCHGVDVQVYPYVKCTCVQAAFHMPAGR